MSAANETMKFTLAAAVATAVGVTSLVCASAFSSATARSRGIGGKAQHFNVPSAILEGDCECKQEVILAVRLALEGKCRVMHAQSQLLYRTSFDPQEATLNIIVTRSW